ncbi:FG-GAP-like repeat-containing protein [Bacteroidota bacterium]
MRKRDASIFILSSIFILASIHSCSQDLDLNEDNHQAFDSDNISFTKSSQTLGNTTSFGLKIGDIDLDNDNDIIFANYNGPCLLWLNNGEGIFSQSSQYFNALNVHDVGLADFNGDSFPDIFLLSHAGPDKIYFNDGDGTFTLGEQGFGSSNDNPQYIDLGDIDNDGDIDAFIYNSNAANKLLRNNGDGDFTMVEFDYGGNDCKGFELADFNGDLFLDLVINMRQSANQIWLNDGTGEFINSGNTAGAGGEQVKCGDIDGDGSTDVVIADYNMVSVWLNENSSGAFVVGYNFDEGALDINLFDADNDGDLDLITAHLENGNKLWLNDGSGLFTTLGHFFGNEDVHSLGCDDLDNDDDFDVVFGQEEGSGGNSIYFNESIIVGIDENKSIEKTNIRLAQNYPNPFHHNTKIEFYLAEPSKVVLKICDAEGRNIKSLINDYMLVGTHEVVWDGKNDHNRNIPAGIYFYKLISNSFAETKRVILMK